MPKTLMELRDADCRFILQGGLYCSEERANPTVSYCTEHLKRCYTGASSSASMRPRRAIMLPVEHMDTKPPANIERPVRDLTESIV